MKILKLLSIIMTVSLVSCKKEVTITNDAEVKLIATTLFQNGNEETRSDSSINKISYGQVINDGISDKFLLNLGATTNSTLISSFGISFVFKQQTRANATSGTYYFPQALDRIRTAFRNELTPLASETLLLPVEGKVVFEYDASTNTISGTIDNIVFNFSLSEPYGRSKVTVNGTFKMVPVL